ncbi:hypothetical protein EBR77_02985 [bacterium]|nr:hypothetical protein [bacterium]NBX77876.1 hypothetical protein [bacterium]
MKKLLLIGLLGLVVNYEANAMLAKAVQTAKYLSGTTKESFYKAQQAVINELQPHNQKQQYFRDVINCTRIQQACALEALHRPLDAQKIYEEITKQESLETPDTKRIKLAVIVERSKYIHPVDYARMQLDRIAAQRDDRA